MTDGVANVMQALWQSLLGVLRFRDFQRPKYKQRSAYNVGARNKSPKTAIQTAVAVVAHSEIVVRGNYEVTALDILVNLLWPGPIWGVGIDTVWQGYRGKLIAISNMIT